jgi:serine/threonine protein phosphatase PrpC
VQSALTSENNSERPEGGATAAPHSDAAGVDSTPTPEQSDEPWWDEPGPVSEEPAAPGAVVEPVPEPTDEPAPDTGPATQPQLVDTAPVIETEGTRTFDIGVAPAVGGIRSRQGLAAAALRDVGRVRSINQDSVFALITTLPRQGMDVSVGLFIVADGMGGHDGGEIASRMAVGTVARQVLAELIAPALADNMTQALQPLLITAVQEANRAIWDYARSIGSDMGTTCTVALLIGHAIYVGHVGDSRAYIHRPGRLACITPDHSAVGRLIQLGQLDPSEAREHPLRSHLYRTVGQQPEVAVDFLYQPVENASHLLLCSDGLWGMLEDEMICDVLDHTIWPQDACRELIARANLAGGEDNISAVVVTLPDNA